MSTLPTGTIQTLTGLTWQVPHVTLIYLTLRSPLVGSFGCEGCESKCGGDNDTFTKFSRVEGESFRYKHTLKPGTNFCYQIPY